MIAGEMAEVAGLQWLGLPGSPNHSTWQSIVDSEKKPVIISLKGICKPTIF